MALKNTVAAERRMDLASLFCMIGRHGPAVALAVIAMVSVLAGFIIYRTVRGKRRKAAARDGETSSAGDEGDASGTHPSPEDRSGESTDVSDEGSSDVTEDADVIQSDLGVRLRPAAAAAAAAAPQKKPPPPSPLHIQIPETRVSTAEEVTPEEAKRSERSVADDTVMEGGVEAEVRDDVSCLKKPESVHDQKVLTAECQEEEEDVTDVPDKKTRHEEENIQWSLNKQTPPVGETSDRWQDNKTTPEMNTEEPPVVIQEASAPHSCRDEENPEEAKRNDVARAEEASVDQQEAAICPTKPPSETEAAMPAVRDEDEGLVAEITEKVDNEDGSKEEENGPACNGEDGGKNRGGSSVSAPAKVDDPELSGVPTDVKGEISFKGDSQRQDEMAASLDVDSTTHETGNLPEERDDPHVPSRRVQQSVRAGDSEGSDMASVAADPDEAENDEEKLRPSPPSTLLTSEEMSHSDMLSSSQDQEDSEAGTAPVPTKDASLSVWQIQFERRGDGVLSPGEESGISSLAVSPDVQDGGGEFGVNVLQSDAQNSLFADDAVLSVGNEDTAEMVLGHYSSCHFQSFHSERSNWTQYEYFAANEDMFGHEIEDGYHRAMDQFTAQLEVSVTSFANGMNTQTDVKTVIELSEIKERRVEKKEDVNGEEKEEDYERTEISIMEATMDNNEWITDSFPVLPWLNVLVQDHMKTSQLPPEEGSAVTDPSSGVPPPTEIKETSSLSLTDENAETNKKVVAVQPMPQNVNVTFCIHYFTRSPHQTVAITGNQQELGNWKGFVPLERAKDGHWSTVVSLPAESHVEWKFVVLDRGEVCRWEECGNRHLDTGYGDDLLVHKWWGLL